MQQEQPVRVEPRQRPQGVVTTRSVRQGIGLAVQEALVRVETGMNQILEFPVPGPSQRSERPLIGGRCVPIEDPVWESLDQYRAEHRTAVARQEEERQREETELSADKEDVEH